MQMKGKLIDQTWENLAICPFGPNFDPEIFFRGFYFYQMLHMSQAIFVSIQFQGKLIIQTQENGKKPHLGQI